MRLAIVGYGKMGKSIEKIAKQRSHTISFIVGQENKQDLFKINATNTDVAVEFSTPKVANANIKQLLAAGVPVVSGTTGWLEEEEKLIQDVKDKQKSFFYASNFSYSLFLFNKLQLDLAKIMNGFEEYEVSIEEIHHTEKKDKPSGTAITLAKGIIDVLGRKTGYVNDKSPEKNEILIRSKRIPDVPGTHNILYASGKDEIMLQHKAKDRMIFATGALDAAEFIIGKKGYFTMTDLVQSKINE
jgi:4-hydroxy-tetrahydrodipicolinate reductase